MYNYFVSLKANPGRCISLLIICLAIFGSLATDTFAASTNGTCDYFSEVQNNPKTKKSFMAHFNYAKSIPLMMYGDFKRQNDHLYKPFVFAGKTFYLDKQTIGCLECHGEMLAIEKFHGQEVLDKNFHSTQGKHAIGLDYHEMVLRDSATYSKPDPNKTNIVFIGGKLGCLSCHNPFSKLPMHLNVSTENSALCKECHKR